MVMPCSRSASSPSTSSAKSMSSPVVPWRALSRCSAASWSSIDQLGVVQQPADQGRLAVVDRAAGQEAQLVAVVGVVGRAGSCPSEIALALLLLHRGGLVAVDQPALPLGDRRGAHLRDDVGRPWRPRIRSRRSADSSRACGNGPGAAPASRRARAAAARHRP